MKRQTYDFRFVEFMPKILDEGVLYVSVTYATASHLCFCGCGMKVVTPLSPTDWRLIFDGDSVSLHPSVGNWGYPCRSHYILRNNRVVWASQMSSAEIRAIRGAEGRDKQHYYRQQRQSPQAPSPAAAPSPPAPSATKRGKRG